MTENSSILCSGTKTKAPDKCLGGKTDVVNQVFARLRKQKWYLSSNVYWNWNIKSSKIDVEKNWHCGIVGNVEFFKRLLDFFHDLTLTCDMSCFEVF